MTIYELGNMVSEYYCRTRDAYGPQGKEELSVLHPSNFVKFLAWAGVEYNTEHNIYKRVCTDKEGVKHWAFFEGFSLTVNGLDCGVFITNDGLINNTERGLYYPLSKIEYFNDSNWIFDRGFSKKPTLMDIIDNALHREKVVS